MVVFEDLHWVDAQTQELLNLLADSIGTARILLLVNYQSEYRHGWGNKTYYTQLRLDPLGRESAEEMLTALLGHGADLISLMGLIIERTEGTPFFTEEMVKMLLDEGALVEQTRHLHERAGLALEAMFAGQLDDHLDELGQHYSRGNNIAKAVGTWGGRAGRRSSALYTEAIELLSYALKLLQPLPAKPERTNWNLNCQPRLAQR